MAYTTADIDAIVANLEGALASGHAEVMFEGRRIIYRSVADIRSAIAYFTALRDNATDASQQTAKVRTYIFYGGDRGFGV